MIEFLSHLKRMRPCRADEDPTVCLSIPDGWYIGPGESIGAVHLSTAEAAALGDLYALRRSGVVTCRDGRLIAELRPPYEPVYPSSERRPATMTLHFYPRENAGMVTRRAWALLPEVEDLGANMDVVARALHFDEGRRADRALNIDTDVNSVVLTLGEVTLSLRMKRLHPREDLLSWLAQAQQALSARPIAKCGVIRPGVGVAELPGGAERGLVFAEAYFPESMTGMRLDTRGPVVFRPGDLIPLFTAWLSDRAVEAFVLTRAVERSRDATGALGTPVAKDEAWLTPGPLGPDVLDAPVAEEDMLEMPW